MRGTRLVSSRRHGTVPGLEGRRSPRSQGGGPPHLFAVWAGSGRAPSQADPLGSRDDFFRHMERGSMASAAFGKASL